MLNSPSFDYKLIFKRIYRFHSPIRKRRRGVMVYHKLSIIMILGTVIIIFRFSYLCVQYFNDYYLL